MKFKFSTLLALILIACNGKDLPVVEPQVITELTLHDTDDPAIWVNPEDPAASIVFGTDKDTDGALYAFDLDGKIIESKTIRGLKRPNNVDLRYGFQLNDSTKTDIVVLTERERKQIRIFSVPDMKPLDNGGIQIFEGETGVEHDLPMGVSLYKSPIDGAFYAIVGRKSGPLNGYLHQYKLEANTAGISATLVRKFGQFSGKKEIEAIAVDDENGIVYYSDEGHCIRKYYAEPSKGDEELACFGAALFREDIEGIAIARFKDGEGYLIVSNQQQHSFVIFDRNSNEFIKELDLTTTETDGCDVVTESLGEKYPSGLFVAMNDAKNFYFFDLSKIIPNN
ncbi:phytase [Robertkochia solimangrovi]|uniref:phytase n=1 Tax=Robertkochia solimangrovi TaxID=2213046 RepID=UPI00117C15AB|nr:phytase [Robertkochia solimangrovi]TRZ45796.1 3-phytase [Robertkochia solimangrovi]